MLNKRKVQYEILNKEVNVSNLHEHVVEYYVQLLRFVECRVNVSISRFNRAACCHDCILLHYKDALYVWVHEAAHYLYTLLDTTQKAKLKEVVCDMCTSCYNFKEKMLKHINTPHQGYVYSALTDAYTIYYQNPDLLFEMPYVYTHSVGYGSENPKEYATKEAWANICELIMYDIKPPKRLEKLYETAAIILEELMIELF